MRPPSVDALARELVGVGLPHPLLVDAAREAIASGDASSARARAEAVARALLRPVINATGVLLHTNLGRAPVEHHQEARYANLELDLETGKRGSRSRHAASLLARAAGAEAALVVNNGAAAVMLVLAALARGRAVVVSRGELVEIGGGFRVPEVLAESGAYLVEVGTTNRTRRRDYEQAVADTDPALILKVHQSNYRIVGFTEAVGVDALGGLGPPVVADLGSGLLDATTPWLATGPPPWLAGEPAVRQTLQAGAALVTFSGDKLLGGPQAGVVAGRPELVERCARHPLARALRPGSLVLSALQETALAYLRRDGDAIAFWRMAATPVATLRERASALAQEVGAGADVVECEATPGGGSVPGLTLASVGLALAGDHTAALRSADTPVIARVHEGRTVIDLRTVDAGADPLVAKAVAGITR
ncbi:MAG: L-seryl-tRNA(Sec) selenium transferase [Actinomycetota bacterium]|nr:L-seryl-tRNA(Sec) selenium transferase [Actinomycetota bacterium]MDQ3679367.1 L-seryl-tRNA(Sec) selenium transferase [Actinomycetota bacterium]